ncbi:transposase [Streptomyces sp. CHA1]|nr:transposase [Streptomyces sp. G11C]MCO6704475.1 transposase [Streptomyces sp. CHB9.2]MCO6710744.1 transposase [Streptomyces sp. CHA3]MCO6716546.1 transposase [Streptomyces sp. CHB19.2]MCO6722679.1 transposase [Streptomyces sp. Vc714c-19]MCO6728477.1 transposase [Streptomyces sp. CHA16]MCO6734472.1 transposase [Streptomyces sp. EL9]MCO6740158.1 transposase [Streptomyces sp. CHA15]MCO6746281.1 transposase [Streptomyces sp. CHA1]MCO6763246.1 transposase [Streptomyces sp. EL5]UUD72042.1 tr
MPPPPPATDRGNADKAYFFREIRNLLSSIRAVMPERAGQQANRLRRGQAGGGPAAFGRDAYKQRNTVGRCVNRLHQWRGLATRCGEAATVHLPGLRPAGGRVRRGRPGGVRGRSLGRPGRRPR